MLNLKWFHIPVKSINRAVNFYSALFDVKLEITQLDGNSAAIFKDEMTRFAAA